ncbi:MAG: hypothetical protein J5588_02920 [Bacteroidales bacterium]|nr:hypothetical protein [Bacteroidales bacterium]
MFLIYYTAIISSDEELEDMKIGSLLAFQLHLQEHLKLFSQEFGVVSKNSPDVIKNRFSKFDLEYQFDQSSRMLVPLVLQIENYFHSKILLDHIETFFRLLAFRDGLLYEDCTVSLVEL